MQKNRNRSQAVNNNQKPAFTTGNNKIAPSTNIANRNNQYNLPNRPTNNQSVKLPKVSTPISNNNIQQSQLP